MNAIEPDVDRVKDHSSDGTVADVTVSADEGSADTEPVGTDELPPMQTASTEVLSSSISSTSSSPSKVSQNSSKSTSPSKGGADGTTKTSTVHHSTPLALDPKVQVPFLSKPGEVPREVMVERFKRTYTKDAAELDTLWNDAVSDESHGFSSSHTTASSHAYISYLPLDLFDDKTFETRDPETVWLTEDALKGGLRCRVASSALIDENETVRGKSSSTSNHHVTWVQGTVVSGDSGSDTYCVRIDRDDVTVTDIPRIDVCFASEDPRSYVKRRLAAFKARTQAAQTLNDELIIDSMPADGLPGVPEHQAHKLLTKATASSNKLKRRVAENEQARNFADALIAENRRLWCRSMNAIDFASVSSDTNNSYRQSENASTSQSTALRVADSSTSSYSFPESFERFKFVTTSTKVEAVECAKLVHQQNLFLISTKRAFDVSSYGLGNSDGSHGVGHKAANAHAHGHAAPSPPFTLEQFIELQRKHVVDVSRYVKTEWSSSIKQAVLQSFATCGKGHYNLHETDRNAFEFSKMKRYLLCCRLKMEDTLRSLQEVSINEFSVFMASALSSEDINVLSTNDVSGSAIGDISTGKRLISMGKQSPLFRSPLFRFEMAVDPGGAVIMDKLGNPGKVPPSFVYTNDLQMFVGEVVETFDHGLSVTQGIKTLDPGVMTDMSWTFWPDLTSVSANDPVVLEARQQLVKNLDSAVSVLKQYLTMYQEYVPLLELDISEEISKLRDRKSEDEDGRLGSYLDAITHHEQHLELINTRVPYEIIVGCFSIDVSKVKHALTTKRETLIEKTKGLIAETPRKICDAINKEFTELLGKLELPRDTPEAIQKTQRPRQHCPKVLRGADVLIRGNRSLLRRAEEPF